MSRILVAYYSWTGRTREIAEAIAAELGADVEEIREARPRVGRFIFLRSVWEAMRKVPAPIEKPKNDPSGYELIVLGTPVWAGHMSAPVRSYLAGQHEKFTRVAVFCTEGGSGGEKVVAEVSALSGKNPVATVIVTNSDFSSGGWRQKVAAFTNALK